LEDELTAEIAGARKDQFVSKHKETIDYMKQDLAELQNPQE